jgi:hypothetical protein
MPFFSFFRFFAETRSRPERIPIYCICNLRWGNGVRSWCRRLAHNLAAIADHSAATTKNSNAPTDAVVSGPILKFEWPN